MSYKNYLETPNWKVAKSKFYKKYNPKKCFLCDKRGKLSVHHTKYKDKNGRSLLFREPSEILVGLCDKCHKTLHECIGNTPHKRSFLKKVKEYMKSMSMEDAFRRVLRETDIPITENHKLKKLGTVAYYKSIREGVDT
jgi:hypothetical protein